MMYVLYNTALFLLSPLLFGLLFLRLLFDKAYREGVGQRLGFFKDGGRRPRARGQVPGVGGQRKLSTMVSDSDLPASGTRPPAPIIWFHAVSVGEVIAAEPLVRAVRLEYPEASLLLSTVTTTGQTTARLRLPEIDRFFYFPFDLPGVVQRVLRYFSPDLFVFLETELWPNFLKALSQKGISSVLVNGRISPRSYRRYRWVTLLSKQVLARVTLFLVQTERDVRYLIDLGADPKKVFRTGNQKYDQALASVPPDPLSLRDQLGILPEHTLFIAGSTHEGEERMLLSTYRSLLSEVPEMVLLLAPRHLDRLPHVEDDVRTAGFVPVLKSKLETGGLGPGARGQGEYKSNAWASASPAPGPRPPTPGPQFSASSPRVILLDTLGELGRLYAAADLIFIGGSLVPIGGHNLLEAAVHGKVVFFGPHMVNFEEVAQQAIDEGCGVQVRDHEDLAESLMGWIATPERVLDGEARARKWVASHRGSVEKNMAWISKLLQGR